MSREKSSWDGSLQAPAPDINRVKRFLKWYPIFIILDVGNSYHKQVVMWSGIRFTTTVILEASILLMKCHSFSQTREKRTSCPMYVPTSCKNHSAVCKTIWWSLGLAILIVFSLKSAKVTSKGYWRYPMSIRVILSMGQGQGQVTKVTKGHQNQFFGHAAHDLWSHFK